MTESAGESWFRSYSLWHVGLSTWTAGDYEQATELERESLRLKHLMDELGIALCFEAIAWMSATNEPRDAALLLGAADALWKKMDTSTTTLPGLRVPHMDVSNMRALSWVMRSTKSSHSARVSIGPPRSGRR